MPTRLRVRTANARASAASLDLSKRGFRCPKARVFAANVVDVNGTRWASGVVYRDRANSSHCAIALQCRAKAGSPDLAVLDCDSMQIADVLSVPPETTTLDLAYNELKRLNLSTAAANGQLKEVNLQDNKLTSMDDVVLPATVQTLSLIRNNITTLTFSRAHSNLVTLQVSYNPIARVEVHASGVATLDAEGIQLARLSDLLLPDSITTLNIGHNPQMAFENFTAPAELHAFRAVNSSITTLRRIDFSTASQLLDIDLTLNSIREVAGVRFPPSLENLLLNGSDVSCFLLRNSDVPVLRGLKGFNVSSLSQTNCTDTDAAAQNLSITGRSYVFSVLDDAAFDARFYPSRLATLTPAPIAPLSTPSGPLHVKSSTASSILVASIVALVVTLLAAAAWVVYMRRRLVPGDETARADSDGDTESSSTHPSGSSLDDVRDDEALVATRIPQNELVRSKELGRGAFGVVYQATLREQTPVIIKQLLPRKAKDPLAVQQFMDEIRLCARLEHPNIVAFLGISWSTLADMAIVMEFMANGDLATLLKTEAVHPRSRETFTWTSVSYEATATRTKLVLAVDMAEALAYLHSFSPPIVHRDLKASNVLLSDAWVAKLSDFGISRHVANDMTAEVGTVAWTAPEVFRGSQYDEAADIYSFGVVMSELDTCQKPFARELVLRSEEGETQVIHDPSNESIALAVAQHNAVPDFHEDCPQQILSLALRCLAANLVDRPTAAELLEELKNIAREENVDLRLTTLAI